MYRTILLAASAALAAPPHAPAAPDPADTRLLQQPAASADRVAFVYAGELWVCDPDGANPRRLTSDLGFDSDPQPAFSPDGRTVAYSARFLWGAFASKPRAALAADHVAAPISRPSWPFLAPAALLSLGTVVCGLWPRVVSDLVVTSARALDPRVPGGRRPHRPAACMRRAITASDAAAITPSAASSVPHASSP